MFKYAGFIRENGKLKLKFTNDADGRAKLFAKAGHTDINFSTLPNEMSKDDAVKWLADNVYTEVSEHSEVIAAYVPKDAPKVKTAKVIEAPVSKTTKKIETKTEVKKVASKKSPPKKKKITEEDIAPAASYAIDSDFDSFDGVDIKSLI